MVTEFDKLVRDRIPEIVVENGETPVTRTVSGDEYGAYLREKLREEVEEYHESHDREELADVLEVVHAIRRFEGLSREDLDELRERKADARGRFREGVVLERVEP